MISDSILDGFPFFATIFISVDMSMDWPMGTLLLRTSQFSFVLVLEKPRTLHRNLLWKQGWF